MLRERWGKVLKGKVYFVGLKVGENYITCLVISMRLEQVQRCEGGVEVIILKR